MKDLMICALATAWVLGVIYAMSRRSRLDASTGHARYTRYIYSADGEPKLVESNDRDFREMVTRVATGGFWPGWPYTECLHGRDCHGKGVHLVRHYPLEYANGAR